MRLKPPLNLPKKGRLLSQLKIWFNNFKKNLIMTLVKFNPFAPVNGFNHINALDRLFSDLFADDYSVKTRLATPSVNITEKDDLYQLAVAAPGLGKEDFKINVEDNTLTISADKKVENETKEGEKVIRKEFGYTAFKRSFTLPENVAVENIKAAYENGVLNVHIPKVEVKKVAQTIEIQ
jgi:HSP20 family protein